jgi:hypothetical protein
LIEQITDNGSIIATIIKAGFTKKGEQFFTPSEFSQQLGYMNRPKGYRVEAHTHKQVQQDVVLTHEVLYVKSGTIRVGLFTDSFTFIKECILTSGDFILLASGGHSVEMVEDSEIIEVKQGPYSQENKIYFKPVQNA